MMKNILFVCVLFLGICNVEALEKDNFSHSDQKYWICSGEEKYKVNIIRYDYYLKGYFINYAEEYNFNLDDYYPIEFKDSPFNENVVDILSADEIVSSPGNYQYLLMYLWQNIYPNKEFVACNQKKSLDEIRNNEYNDYKLQIDKFLEGPIVNNDTIILYDNEEYIIDYDFMNYYELYDGKNIAKIDKNQLIINGPVGHYIIELRRKANFGVDNILYTDGKNYLLINPSSYRKRYQFNVEIKNNDTDSILVDEEIVESSEVEQNIPPLNIDFEKKNVEINSNFNNTDQKEKNIDHIEDIMVNDSDDDNINNELDSFSFVPENTISYAGIGLSIITILIYVWFKKVFN